MRHLIIFASNRGDSVPHGIPSIPSDGWGTISVLGDEPSGLGPKSVLTPKSVDEPASEGGCADPFQRLRVELPRGLGGIAKKSLVGQGKELLVHLRNWRMILSCKNADMRQRLRGICRYALNILKGNRGVENLTGVIDQEEVWVDMDSIFRLPPQKNQFTPAKQHPPSKKSEDQTCYESMFTTAPTWINPAVISNAALMSDEVAERGNDGAFVHVMSVADLANASDQATARDGRC